MFWQSKNLFMKLGPFNFDIKYKFNKKYNFGHVNKSFIFYLFDFR
jgi:hypothetical protein